MSFGFQVKNDNNQVLIDSDLSHYHFIAKFNHISVTQIPDIMDGPGVVSFGPNNNKDMTGLPHKGYIYKYHIFSEGPVPPMCFLTNSAYYTSVILTQRYDYSKWEVWVLHKGNSSGTAQTAPVIYAFGPRNQFDGYFPLGDPSGYGLRTYDSSGEITFDSLLKPLRIIAGGNITAGALAHTGASGSGFTASLNDQGFGQSSSFSYPYGSNGDMLLYCPSIAHACHQYEFAQADSGTSNWQRYAWSRGDIWWAFYRSGFRILGNSSSGYSFQTGYTTYARGHVWQHVASSANVFVALILGALTGGLYFALAIAAVVASGAFTSAGVSSGGYLPYANGSRNTTLPNTYLVTRKQFYD